MERKHPGLDSCPTIPACLGDSGVEERPGGRGLAPARLLSGSRNLAPAPAALDEAAATFRREPGLLSARWQEALQGSSAPAFTARVGGAGGDPPRARQQRLGGLSGPKHISQSPPQPSKHAPSP